MGLFPSPPKPVPPPKPANPAITAIDAQAGESDISPSTGSLITTAARGLKRRANTQRSSLIGGG